MIVLVIPQTDKQVIAVHVIFTWGNIVVFFCGLFKDVVITSLKLSDGICLGQYFPRKLVSVVNHLLNQFTHLFIPGQFWFILYAVEQITQDMLQTFLVILAIPVKRLVMVVYHNPAKSSAGVFFTPAWPLCFLAKYNA